MPDACCRFFRTTEIFFGQSPQKGATSMLYCATAPELKGMQGMTGAVLHARVQCGCGKTGNTPAAAQLVEASCMGRRRALHANGLLCRHLADNRQGAAARRRPLETSACVPAPA